MKINEIIKIEYFIKIKTGLKIGGLSETTKIGGIDNPVIKVKKLINNEDTIHVPYIPGSSIKGKMRALLEWNNKDEELIRKVFGYSCKKNDGCENNNDYVTRAIFRDSYPIINSNLLKEIIEVKPENVIKFDKEKKVLSATPRFQERVIPGTLFYGEIVLSIHEGDKKEKFNDLLKEGFKLIEENYLGGSGTRGYGKVEIVDELRKSDKFSELRNQYKNDIERW